MLKKLLKFSPIIYAVVVGLVITVIVSIFYVITGRHFYYRIYERGNEITDLKVEQLNEDNEPISLIEVSDVKSSKSQVIIYFDAINSGEGRLSISYSFNDSVQGNIRKTRVNQLNVSDSKIIYLGGGLYNHNGSTVIHIGVGVYSLLMIIYSICRRRRLKKVDRYSYSYMSTWAVQIFFTSIFLVYAIGITVSLARLGYIDTVLLSEITRFTMLLITAETFPVVVLFAIAMTISNISLMRHEGKRLRNMLGIFAGLGLLATIAGIVIVFLLSITLGKESRSFMVFYSVVNAFYIVFFSVLCSSIISGLQAGRHKPSMDIDYIVILGCAIRKDGTLYPLIRGRVDRAIQFWNDQKTKTGKCAVFVPSGGQGSDEIISEGEAMKRYLLEQGIDEEYILPETNSRTTYENMKFSKELIEQRNPSAKVAFSTTNYHVMRSGIHAAQAGLKAEGMGAKTKWYFWPNALLREVVGLFAYQPKVQIICMIILGFLAGAAGYASYAAMVVESF